MSKHSKKTRAVLRAHRCRLDVQQQLADIETLRAFVAAEIPSLDSQAAWTPRQHEAIVRLYLSYQQDPRWLCAHDCGRTVARFGDQCRECLKHEEPLGPVDWDSIGA